MLIIRPEQMHAFVEAGVRALRDELTAHAQACHTQAATSLGEAGLARVVGATIDDAIEFGLAGLPAVCRLLDLVLVFGPPLPAAMRSVLVDPIHGTPARRLRKVWNGALFQLEGQT